MFRGERIEPDYTTEGIRQVSRNWPGCLAAGRAMMEAIRRAACVMDVAWAGWARLLNEHGVSNEGEVHACVCIVYCDACANLYCADGFAKNRNRNVSGAREDSEMVRATATNMYTTVRP